MLLPGLIYLVLLPTMQLSPGLIQVQSITGKAGFIVTMDNGVPGRLAKYLQLRQALPVTHQPHRKTILVTSLSHLPD